MKNKLFNYIIKYCLCIQKFIFVKQKRNNQGQDNNNLRSSKKNKSSCIEKSENK